jgi:uncharacterized protein (TIGR02466 family)
LATKYWAVSIRGIIPALHVGEKGSSPLRSTNRIIMNDLISIFPTSVMRKVYASSFNNEQLDLFNNSDRRRIAGNSSSVDTYILDRPELADLKQFCLAGVLDYFERVVGASGGVEPYITQSWLNWTESGEAHHQHYHGNSIVSGVFYISTEQEDSIEFIKKDEPPYTIIPKQWTYLNSLRCKVPAEEKVLLLFPSELLHEVKPRDGHKTRISLSFNTYVRGKIGSRDLLNELILR